MVPGSVVHHQYDPGIYGYPVRCHMWMIKTREKYLLHSIESSTRVYLEKYPINTLYRACFLGIEDLSYKSNDYKRGILVTCYSWVKKGGYVYMRNFKRKAKYHQLKKNTIDKENKKCLKFWRKK